MSGESRIIISPSGIQNHDLMNVRTAGALTDLLLPRPKAISKVKIVFASLKMLEIAPAL